MKTNPLIDAEALAAALSDPKCVAVDCRFQLTEPESGYAAYLRGHLPGAIYAHLDDDLSADPAPHEGRHPLPRPSDLAEKLGSWGIDNSTLVVAYDDASGAIAARLWWLLHWLGHDRVSVLDGGLPAWIEMGGTLEQGITEPQAANFIPKTVHDRWVVATGDIPLAIGSGALILDARSTARFRGEEEPIDPVAGHVPGARNLPLSELLGEDGRFLPKDELRSCLRNALDGHASSAVVTMCGSGVTACHLSLGFAAAGFERGRLYAGSWSEWIRDDGREIAVGAD